ncbi:MAG: ZIP family metal transporter [Candidatus Lokiarchaeota archaeon]|nr:ZIP family metal transporter [Candidatus Lokiarchaeota archaeon]
MLSQFTPEEAIWFALLATLFTYGVTALGAGLVVFFKAINKRALALMLGFAAGVMIAASFWSLLAPSISLAEAAAATTGVPCWLPALAGFLGGVAFLWLLDKIIPHLHRDMPIERAEGIKTSKDRSTLLVLAITIHNIPEGLAVGVAFGAIAAGVPEATLGGAVAVAIGIGIQNFPEGTAVSVPLRQQGMSLGKSFLYGQLSGIVEPIAGVVGALAVIAMQHILPYALAFAAGAMIFVVAEELIPEPVLEGNTHLATLGLVAGFAVMMVLDVALS